MQNCASTIICYAPVGYLMDIYNREDNHWTVSLLDIGETSKVLEIGFGTGLAIAEAAKIAKHGQIYGIDHSETMLEAAQKRNRKAVALPAFW